MATYAAAFDDALGTFDGLGARAELPRLMHDLVHRRAGIKAAGHADDRLTPPARFRASLDTIRRAEALSIYAFGQEATS